MRELFVLRLGQLRVVRMRDHDGVAQARRRRHDFARELFALAGAQAARQGDEQRGEQREQQQAQAKPGPAWRGRGERSGLRLVRGFCFAHDHVAGLGGARHRFPADLVQVRARRIRQRLYQFVQLFAQRRQPVVRMVGRRHRLAKRGLVGAHAHAERLGRMAAVVEYGRLRLTGVLAWWFWLWIHLFFLIGFRNRLVVMIEWAWSYFSYQRGARIILGEQAGGAPRSD